MKLCRPVCCRHVWFWSVFSRTASQWRSYPQRPRLMWCGRTGGWRRGSDPMTSSPSSTLTATSSVLETLSWTNGVSDIHLNMRRIHSLVLFYFEPSPTVCRSFTLRPQHSLNCSKVAVVCLKLCVLSQLKLSRIRECTAWSSLGTIRAERVSSSGSSWTPPVTTWRWVRRRDKSVCVTQQSTLMLVLGSNLTACLEVLHTASLCTSWMMCSWVPLLSCFCASCSDSRSLESRRTSVCTTSQITRIFTSAPPTSSSGYGTLTKQRMNVKTRWD